MAGALVVPLLLHAANASAKQPQVTASRFTPTILGLDERAEPVNNDPEPTDHGLDVVQTHSLGQPM